MTTLTPPCKLAIPENQCRIDYVMKQAHHKDFEFPSVSFWLGSCGRTDGRSSFTLTVPFDTTTFIRARNCHRDPYSVHDFKVLTPYIRMEVSKSRQKMAHFKEGNCSHEACFPILGAEMMVFGDCAHASAQLFPKLMAFSVCLSCRLSFKCTWLQPGVCHALIQ